MGTRKSTKAIHIIHHELELEGNKSNHPSPTPCGKERTRKVLPTTWEFCSTSILRSGRTSCPNTLSGPLGRRFCVQFGASDPQPRTSRVGPRSQGRPTTPFGRSIRCKRQREPNILFQEQSQNYIGMRWRSENFLSEGMSRRQIHVPVGRVRITDGVDEQKIKVGERILV